jgi:hypothetical protein
MKNVFTIYFGGSLFNHKDLTGNALLAESIEKCSGNKYRCCLPQNVEQHQTSALDIRNKDIAKIIECDLGLFKSLNAIWDCLISTVPNWMPVWLQNSCWPNFLIYRR